jgi:hypothetical protein
MKTNSRKSELPKGAVRKAAVAVGLTREELLAVASWWLSQPWK